MSISQDLRTAEHLLTKLEKMAGEWRAHPYLSNDYGECLRYNEIRDELSTRFGIEVDICPVDDPLDYRVIRG